MRPVVWASHAQRDGGRAYRNIAQFNLPADRRVAADIHAAALILHQHPYAGRGVAGGRRELGAGDYILVYRVRASETRILRVWHGAQDRAGSRSPSKP